MNLMYSLPAALMYLVLCVAVLQVFTCHASTGFSETLREAASRHSLYMGSEFDGALVGAKGTSHIDVQYRNMHAHEYSLSTVGNMCKWAATHPEQHLFTLQDCNSAYAYARQSWQQFLDIICAGVQTILLGSQVSRTNGLNKNCYLFLQNTSPE